MYVAQIRETKRLSWRNVPNTNRRTRPEAQQAGQAYLEANKDRLFAHGRDAEVRTVTESRAASYAASERLRRY